MMREQNLLRRSRRVRNRFHHPYLAGLFLDPLQYTAHPDPADPQVAGEISMGLVGTSFQQLPVGLPLGLVVNRPLLLWCRVKLSNEAMLAQPGNRVLRYCQR